MIADTLSRVIHLGHLVRLSVFLFLFLSISCHRGENLPISFFSNYLELLTTDESLVESYGIHSRLLATISACSMSGRLLEYASAF